MDNGLLLHLLIKFFIPQNYLVMEKRVPFCAGKRQLLGKRKNIVWQMSWTIPFLLTFSVIPGFPVLAPVFNTVVLLLLWGYKGGINSGILSVSFPLFLCLIICAASRRGSDGGMLGSSYSQLLTWTSCVIAANFLVWIESWNHGMVWTKLSKIS